jgi:hypothetical protein
MLLSHVITSCYHPMLLTHVITQYYDPLLLSNVNAQCYHPCYHPVIQSHFIIPGNCPMCYLRLSQLQFLLFLNSLNKTTSEGAVTASSIYCYLYGKTLLIGCVFNSKLDIAYGSVSNPWYLWQQITLVFIFIFS